MLSSAAFQQHINHLGLSAEARHLVATIRTSPPSRNVAGRGGNVCVRYPSRKMGHTIQAESHHVELAAIYLMEHDPAVLEYYDQPPPLTLTYRSPHGRTVTVRHTPDFFVIRTDGMVWEEWKHAEALPPLAARMPARYVQNPDGTWHCPPGEAAAAEWGLAYHVRTSAEINWTVQRNLRFLEDYLRSDCPPVVMELATAIQAAVQSEHPVMLTTLLTSFPSDAVDAIYTLIATDAIHVDLTAAPLVEPERVWVVPHGQIPPPSTVHIQPSMPTEGTTVLWDSVPWLVINRGEQTVALLSETGTVTHVDHATLVSLQQSGIMLWKSKPDETRADGLPPNVTASPADWHEAYRRYTLLRPLLERGTAAAISVPPRTVRRWLARYRAAERDQGCGYLGLLPQQRRGNETTRLDPMVQALMEKVITTHYERPQRPSMHASYALLVQRCQEQEMTAPSYPTLAAAIHRRPRTEQLRKRQGKRAAYQQQPFYWELTAQTPRHGDRPFEIAHIDHTELDMMLVCSRTGQVLGRPWLTLLMDAFSRRVLALALIYDPPSYRSCMLVLRDCVRRHQRLPQTLVVDGGTEFGSIYFETLLARYEVTKKTRPGGQPRFGSVIERLFDTAHTTFMYTLTGNTQALRDGRQMTTAVDPRNLAQWTLGRFQMRLEEWATEVYDTTPHPSLGMAPREAFTQGFLSSGFRLHRRIADDETFRIWTLPTTRRGTALVHATTGIKINTIWYWAEVFRQPAVERTRVPVRYDPFDAGIAYAYVQGQWVRCISEHYAQFQGRSEREIQLASAELRKRRQCHAHQSRLTAGHLARFLTSLEAEEVLHDQRQRDAERRASQPELVQPPAKTEAPHSSARDAELPPPIIYEDF